MHSCILFAADLKRLVSSIAFVFVLFGLFAQVSLPNSIQAVYTDKAVDLDGHLIDSIWQVAPRINNFTQRELNFGEPSTEKTEVALAYDDMYLYIAVWCFDSSPDEIIAKELRRDFDHSLDDNFKVIFDTYDDDRNGFMFITNPNAARAELQVFNNGGSTNAYWDAVWDVKTTITAEGWFAEFAIPFYTLRYRQGIVDQVWGVNFERNIRRKREQVLWQGWDRNNSIEQINQGGTILGLNLDPKKQFVELKPYAIAGAEREGQKNSGVLNAGGDLNYLLSPTYRLNLTVNTDFAQVESDQQQVNLTRFPLFFPELREFFLEGADYFDMGFGGNRVTPFYSRRIGLDQNREAVPIIAGARLLGKEKNRTIGIMSLQTAASGNEPTTNYSIGSWRQDLGSQSVAGLMTVNKFQEGRWHSTTGVNGRYSTSKFFKKRNLAVGGAFIQSYDSDTSYNAKAFAYRAFINYFNDKLFIVASTQQSPEPFDAEVGLMRRRNFQENFALINVRPRPKNHLKWIRQFDFRPLVLTYTQFDDTKELQTFEYAFKFMGFDTKSGETIGMEYIYKAEGLRQDFNITPEITIADSTYWWNEYLVYFNTFQGRTLSGTFNFRWGEFFDGSANRLETGINWRASKYINFATLYGYNHVELPSGVFTTNLISVRAQYALNPNTFGSVFGQWNSDQEVFNFNFRLRYIPKIGRDFYLIVNRQVSTAPGGSSLEARTTVLGKLIWRFIL